MSTQFRAGFIASLSAVSSIVASTESAKLTSPNPSFADSFGRSVATDGNRIAVGAPLGGPCPSRPVWVFARLGGGWTLDAEVAAPAAVVDCFFGYSIAVDADWLVVGSPEGAFDMGPLGRSIVYRQVGGMWSQDAIIEPSQSEPWDRFGAAVDIDEDRIAVGAFGVGSNSGAVYVFRRDGGGWIEEARLAPAELMPQHYFGQSLALRGPVLVVGAAGDDTLGDRAGAVYVFRRDGTTWNQEQKLAGSGASEFDAFGSSVSI